MDLVLPPWFSLDPPFAPGTVAAIQGYSEDRLSQVASEDDEASGASAIVPLDVFRRPQRMHDMRMSFERRTRR